MSTYAELIVYSLFLTCSIDREHNNYLKMFFKLNSLIHTAPLQQWLVRREYRLRVRRAFNKHDIVIGRPQWITYSASLNGKDSDNLPSNSTNGSKVLS